MSSIGPIFVALLVMISISAASPYHHWDTYDDSDFSDYNLDDLKNVYARLQKRFLLGLGLTKNTPGKEFFMSGEYGKPHKRQ